MNKRKAAAGLAAAIAAVAGVGVVGGPADAAPTQTPGSGEVKLVGNFLSEGDGGAGSAANRADELFVYVPGIGADTLVDFDRDGGPGGEVTYDETVLSVNGSYRPVAGNFDNDGWDEIIWYGPGAAPDFLWNFNGSTTPTSSSLMVNGTYQPYAGDFTADGVDDVFWYAPGTAQDHIWDFNNDGGYRTQTFTANGTYTPLVGTFADDDTDDILWYAPGSAPDYMWDFRVGQLTYDNRTYQANGTYRPFVFNMFGDDNGDDVFWYAPGTAPDYIWDFNLGIRSDIPQTVNGTYTTAAGDFFGDRRDDILFFNVAGFVLWEHSPITNGVQRYEYLFFDLPLSGLSASAAGPSASRAVQEAPNDAAGTSRGTVRR